MPHMQPDSFRAKRRQGEDKRKNFRDSKLNFSVVKMEKKEFPEQNEIVLCNVDRILGTTVFVRMPKYGNKEGVIATSEVAPGRIRNIRDHVNVGKRIVCKILRVDEKTGHVDLSLRRVIKKEKEDMLDLENRERDALAMLRTIVKEKAEEIAEKIAGEYPSLVEFMQNIKNINTEPFGLGKTEKEQIVKILSDKPKKIVSIKAKFKLSSQDGEGILKIKEIFAKAAKSDKDAKISYISAPNYSVFITAPDYKEAKRKLDGVLKVMEEQAEEKECEIEISER